MFADIHTHTFTTDTAAFNCCPCVVTACYFTPPDSTDIREPAEDLVRRDRTQYGAEDSRSTGQRQESQGTD